MQTSSHSRRSPCRRWLDGEVFVSNLSRLPVPPGGSSRAVVAIKSTSADQRGTGCAPAGFGRTDTPSPSVRPFHRRRSGRINLWLQPVHARSRGIGLVGSGDSTRDDAPSCLPRRHMRSDRGVRLRRPRRRGCCRVVVERCWSGQRLVHRHVVGESSWPFLLLLDAQLCWDRQLTFRNLVLTVTLNLTFMWDFAKDALVDVVGDDGGHDGLSGSRGRSGLHRSGQTLRSLMGS